MADTLQVGDTMPAAVFYGPRDVRVEEVPVPDEIGPDEVLVRVDRTAICGTDLHPYEGHMDMEDEVVLGHEFLGAVVRTGSAVTQVVEGDVVACACSCGNCYFCRRAEPGRCLGLRMFGMGMALGGLQGAQAGYVVVPYADRNLRKLPVDASDAQLDDLLLVGDIITTGYEAVKKAFRPGDIVVDAVGHVSALAASATYVRSGGTVSIPGVYLDDLELPWGSFWLKGVSFQMGVTHFNNSMDEVISLVRAGHLEPSRVISHRMPLSRAAEAYELFSAREATKIVLDPRS
jgi:threonine dehydrogenase-like Zn-dependent dehydrogenase